MQTQRGERMSNLKDLIRFTEYLVDCKIIFDEIPASEILPCILKFIEENPKTDGFILDQYFRSNCNFFNGDICSIINEYPYDCRCCDNYKHKEVKE